MSWRNGLYNPAFVCGYPIADGAVVPADGLQRTYLAGLQADIPLLIGTTANEGGGKLWMPDLPSFVRGATSEFGALGEQFLSAYPASDDIEAVRQGSNALGDRLFTWQSWIWANLHCRHLKSPAYFFKFSRIPPYPPDAKFAETNGDPRTELGAIHGAELPYFFRNLHSRQWPWTTYDRELSNVTSEYWLNFARHGTPNGAGLPEWRPFDGTNVMEFGDEIMMRDDPFDTDRLHFWNDWFGLNGR